MKLKDQITVKIQGVDTVLDNLDIVMTDINSLKLVIAVIHAAARPIVLWKGPAYSQIGDYTQDQVEARILEILGSDMQIGIQKLIDTNQLQIPLDSI